MNEKEIRVETKKEIISLLITCLCPLFLTIFLDLFYYLSNYQCIYCAQIKPFLLSTIIIYCIFILLWGIFNDAKKANIILVVIVTAFSIINQIKIFYTEEPIGFSDFAHLFDTGEIIGIVESTLSNTVIKYLPSIITVIFTIIVFSIIAIKSNIRIEKRKYRLFAIIISTIILVILFLPFEFEKDLMLNYVFDISKRKDYNRFTTPTTSIVNYGVVAGMYEQMLESRIFEPEDYDEDELNMILENVEKNSNTQKTPNIILMFSESFWDIDQLTEVQFDKQVTSNFNKLKNEGKFVNIISPSYGGVSTNIEFELLTGTNTSYFTTGYIPYMQLYKNDTYYNRESIIKNLKENGYKTKILTANSEKLYNCGKVYKYMQIDEVEYLDSITDENAIKGYYVSDEYITDKVIADFSNKQEGQPIFYMAQTMQAHMPYEIEKYDEYDIQIINSNLTGEMNEVLLSYAQGIYDADKQLGRMYEYINTLDEDTIIVFFGDHLPYLKTKSGDNLLDELVYFNTSDENINTYRKYNTQALILANYDISGYDEVNYLGNDLILTYILNNTGMKISNYYNWLYKTKDVIASNNHFIAVDENGTIYNINDLTKEMETVYKVRKKMQYKLLVK